MSPRACPPSASATRRYGSRSGSGRPIAAAQRHDRDRDRAWRPPRARRGHRGHGRAVTDADGRAIADRPAQDLGREPADHPAGQVLGAGDGRGEVDARRARSRRLRVAAAGLSTAVRSTIRISTMPSARARLSSRDTCGRVTPSAAGDRVLRLTELVIEAAGPHQLVEVAQCTDVLNRCACIVRTSSGRRPAPVNDDGIETTRARGPGRSVER